MNSAEIFKRFPGLWNFTRIAKSKTPNLPSGTIEGQASFTEAGTDALHYQETGRFSPDVGDALEVRMEYFYYLNTQENRIEKYFAKDGQKTGLFYALKFSQGRSPSLEATGDHLCIADTYKASYQFPSPNDDDFKSFRLTYTVNGPKKDYTTETIFELKSSIKPKNSG